MVLQDQHFQVKQDEERTLLLDFLLNGNRSDASVQIHRLINQGYTIRLLYDDVIKPVLYRVGELWETNLITVAEEHTATSITEAVMNELFGEIISKKRAQKKVVLTCAGKEAHQVGLKMVADMFEMKGWDTFFPGSSVPAKDLIEYIRKINPDILAISTSVYYHLPSLQKMLSEIRVTFPNLPILAGGQAFRHGGLEILTSFDLTTYIADLGDLIQYIDTFDTQINEQGSTH